MLALAFFSQLMAGLSFIRIATTVRYNDMPRMMACGPKSEIKRRGLVGRASGIQIRETISSGVGRV